jgi:3-methyl-2-oxobutanoate hydroxymethyltransferase
VVSRLVEIGIPVLGHVGLTPQSVHQFGGYRRVGKSSHEAERVIEEARILQQAGAFAVVLESIPDEVAKAITQELAIPTIGIGAGPHCDGQVLVSYDAFGLYEDTPPFVKRYADLGGMIVKAASEYISDVRSGRFPAAAARERGQ